MFCPINNPGGIGVHVFLLPTEHMSFAGGHFPFKLHGCGAYTPDLNLLHCG